MLVDITDIDDTLDGVIYDSMCISSTFFNVQLFPESTNSNYTQLENSQSTTRIIYTPDNDVSVDKSIEYSYDISADNFTNEEVICRGFSESL